MIRTAVLLSFLALWAYAAHPSTVPKEIRELTGDALIEHINKQGKWQAENYPRFAGKSTEELRQFLGALKKPSHMRRRGIPAKDITLKNAPKSFDSVENWPQCASIIGQIQDQSACGSCWAVSTTSAMSDRLCIASNGKVQTQISALDLMACCSWCGYQCEGGWPDEAWYKFQRDGLVTGSNYTDDSLCKPYTISPCVLDKISGKHKCPDKPTDDYRCEKKCQKSYTAENYKKDHYYGKDVTVFNNQNDAAIDELLKNGPIVAAFNVFEDFYLYKSGVYEYTSGKLVGGHAVRIVGYGETDEGVKYWKVANSWDWYWGEAGYFRILRGSNDCQFESEITSGTVDLTRSLKDK